MEQKTLKHFGTSRLKAGADEVLFVPLGGVGEIGMNLYCYGHNGRWLVVDYKTGDVQEEHATQIERYAEGLTSVLGTRPGTLRVYLRDQIDVYGS